MNGLKKEKGFYLGWHNLTRWDLLNVWQERSPLLCSGKLELVLYARLWALFSPHLEEFHQNSWLCSLFLSISFIIPLRSYIGILVSPQVYQEFGFLLLSSLQTHAKKPIFILYQIKVGSRGLIMGEGLCSQSSDGLKTESRFINTLTRLFLSSRNLPSLISATR